MYRPYRKMGPSHWTLIVLSLSLCPCIAIPPPRLRNPPVYPIINMSTPSSPCFILALQEVRASLLSALGMLCGAGLAHVHTTLRAACIRLDDERTLSFTHPHRTRGGEKEEGDLRRVHAALGFLFDRVDGHLEAGGRNWDQEAVLRLAADLENHLLLGDLQVGRITFDTHTMNQP